MRRKAELYAVAAEETHLCHHQWRRVSGTGRSQEGGILLTAVSAVFLNLFFNGYRREAAAAAKRAGSRG